jgi:hypothetical protein
VLRSSSEPFTSAFPSSGREKFGNVFVKGVAYKKDSEQNCRKAADEFQQALQLDPKYSQRRSHPWMRSLRTKEIGHLGTRRLDRALVRHQYHHGVMSGAQGLHCLVAKQANAIKTRGTNV